MNELLIDLKDLAKRILLQWRPLLLSMIVCALLVSLCGTAASLMAANDAELELKAQVLAGVPEDQLIAVPDVVWFDPGNMMLGLILGVLIVCCAVAAEYMFSGKLRVADDVEQGFGVPVLGFFKLRRQPPKFHPGVDQWIERIFNFGKPVLSEKAKVAMINTELRLISQKNNARNVYFISSRDGRTLSKLKSICKNQLIRTAEHIEIGNSIVTDAKSLEKLAEMDGVVLFEQVDYSTYEDIKKTVALCKRYGVTVLGSIVVG